MNNLTGMFWDEHFINKDREKLSKIKQKIYDWLNEDNFNGFVLNSNIFWIELTWSQSRLPNYICNYIIKWAKRKGFTYLYNLKEGNH
jgi:hypothetical protein